MGIEVAHKGKISVGGKKRKEIWRIIVRVAGGRREVDFSFPEGGDVATDLNHMVYHGCTVVDGVGGGCCGGSGAGNCRHRASPKSISSEDGIEREIFESGGVG